MNELIMNVWINGYRYERQRERIGMNEWWMNASMDLDMRDRKRQSEWMNEWMHQWICQTGRGRKSISRKNALKNKKNKNIHK